MEWKMSDALSGLANNPDPLTRLTSNYYFEMEKAAVAQFENDVQKNPDAVLPGSYARKELKSTRKLLRKQYQADLQLAVIQFFVSKNLFIVGSVVITLH